MCMYIDVHLKIFFDFLSFIQSMAVCRFTTDMVAAIVQEELNEEDEEAVCSESESENSDDDDPEYLPQGQAGVLRVSGDPARLHEDSFDDEDDLSDESSEEETQTQSSRLSKNGSPGMRIPPLMAQQEAIIS